MQELSKSIQRRLHDSNFVARYFVGEGIDVGARSDSLNQYAELFPLVTGIRIWDVNDGDAEFMNGCTDAQYDFVHSSHCLEHIDDDGRNAGDRRTCVASICDERARPGRV